MKLSLTRRQRAMLLFLSASGYTAWFSGVGERGEAQGFATESPAGVSISERRLPPRVASVISHDPFSGKPTVATNAPNAKITTQTGGPNGSAASGTTPRTPTSAAASVAAIAGGGLGAGARGNVVPNIGADPNVASDATGPTLTLMLRATIIGRNPVAYVENGTMMDIVRVGDSLGDRRVAKIDLRGIAFTDGSRLDLPDTYISTPAPRRPTATQQRGLTLNDLRRLLIPPQPSATQGSSEGAPLPAPTGTYPTPGPLPTVNTQGLPVGVNPTPNPYNPTPYPYPYPYAPPR